MHVAFTVAEARAVYSLVNDALDPDDGSNGDDAGSGGASLDLTPEGPLSRAACKLYGALRELTPNLL